MLGFDIEANAVFCFCLFGVCFPIYNYRNLSLNFTENKWVLTRHQLTLASFVKLKFNDQLEVKLMNCAPTANAPNLCYDCEPGGQQLERGAINNNMLTSMQRQHRCLSDFSLIGSHFPLTGCSIGPLIRTRKVSVASTMPACQFHFSTSSTSSSLPSSWSISSSALSLSPSNKKANRNIGTANWTKIR